MHVDFVESGVWDSAVSLEDILCILIIWLLFEDFAAEGFFSAVVLDKRYDDLARCIVQLFVLKQASEYAIVKRGGTIDAVNTA